MCSIFLIKPLFVSSHQFSVEQFSLHNESYFLKRIDSIISSCPNTQIPVHREFRILEFSYFFNTPFLAKYDLLYPFLLYFEKTTNQWKVRASKIRFTWRLWYVCVDWVLIMQPLIQIIKHAQSVSPSNVSGQLLGHDANGLVEVTYAYGMPTAEGDLQFVDKTEFQQSMINCLGQVGIDSFFLLTRFILIMTSLDGTLPHSLTPSAPSR